MSAAAAQGVAYERLCQLAQVGEWRVRLEIEAGTWHEAQRGTRYSTLNRLAVQDSDGQELAFAWLPRTGRLNEAADLLLDDLKVG